MAKKEKTNLKSLSKDELATKLRELEAGLFQTRLKKVTGQLEDVASLWRTRKEIARVKTFQSQQAGKR